jgi:Leucine-rich repeat (LRR) protein
MQATEQLTELEKLTGKTTQDLMNEKTLSLHWKKLSKVPTEIGRLTHLEKLTLYGNQLTELPLEIGNLTNLKELSLQNNQLKKLPKEIGKLTQLQHLVAYPNDHIISKILLITSPDILTNSNPFQPK